MGMKFSLEEIRERVYKLNPNIAILEEFHKETGKTNKRIRRFVKCKCLNDGHIWEAMVDNILKGTGCPKCSGSLKLTLSIIKSRLCEINSNIEIISEIYVNNSTKLKCRCLIDGYEWETTWGNLSQGCGCPNCANHIIRDKQEIEKELSSINPHIKVLDVFFKPNGKKVVVKRKYIKCKCLVDGYEWEVALHSLLKGHGCPNCANRNKRGENSSTWKGGITPLSFHIRSTIGQWKQDSLKGADYKCYISGSKRDLEVHHAYNFPRILKETLEIVGLPIYNEVGKYSDKELKLIENVCLELHYKYGLGICLSKKIHKKFHSIYGKSNNTIEQIDEFKKEYLKQNI